jgi:signal transduction histidine kinase
MPLLSAHPGDDEKNVSGFNVLEVEQKADSACSLYKKGNYGKAKSLLLESINICENAGAWETAAKQYEILIAMDSAMNNFRGAFKHLKEKEQILRKLYASKRESISEELKNLYGTDSLQQQIADVDHSIQTIDEHLNLRKKLIVILSIIAGIFIAGGLAGLNIYRKKKKQNRVYLLENEENSRKLELLTEEIDSFTGENRRLTRDNAVLEKSNAVKDKLLSVISHDLRSPMSSLQALLNLFNANNIARRDLVDFFGKLLSRVENTSTMLENLLHWSQYQLNGIEPIYEKVDIQKVIDDSINFYRMQAEQKHIVIDNALKTAVHIFADVEMLKIILRNLISNALKFTNSGGIITIKALNREGYMIVSVKDTGVGISPENQAKMFSTVNFTTPGTEKEKGTGLGLTLCKDFVEHNHGKIWLDSKVGVGTTFYFSIPLAE